jgi:hypothetical protein
MKDFTRLIAIDSFSVPGGPDTSSIWPLGSPPESNLSTGGQCVGNFSESDSKDAADCVNCIDGPATREL